MNVLNPSGRLPLVGDVAGFDCTVEEGGWPWAEENAEAIAAHWKAAVERKPSMFNGRVLIATEIGIEYSRLSAVCTPVDYAALNFWKNCGFPPADAFNLFGAGVVVSSDGAVLMGEMAAHTANAGQIYFPCGTPDTGDVVDGRLDLEHSLRRELEEEAGLGEGHLVPADARWMVRDGPLFCCARRFDSPLGARDLADLVEAHRAAQKQPELGRVLLVRDLDELPAGQVPAFALALAAQVLD